MKRANRPLFVKKLITFLRDKLQQKFAKTFSVIETLERVLVKLPDGVDEQECMALVGRVFGIRNYALCWGGSLEIENLAEQIFEKLPEKGSGTFCVRVKRSQPHKYGSSEAEREIGSVLLEKGIDMDVKMKDPDMQIDIEFFNDTGFFTFEKKDGAGGLPVNSAGKVLTLISAGFDSPVAAYRVMRRGARSAFVSFHAYPYTDKVEQGQVKELVKILSDYQFDTRLLMVPLGKIQKEISAHPKIPARYRTLLYRRLMLRIASRLAYKEKAKALVTGDSLGQVASQTLENIFAVDAVAELPVYRPLISFDKEVIITEAKEIGTHDISARPCKDTCAMFSSRKAEVRANDFDLSEFEKLLPMDEYLERALSEVELIEFP